MNRLSALRTTAAGMLLLLALLFGPVSSEAQPYRQWVDTTLPALIVPDMFTADTTIPLFLHILTFPDAYPVSNMWDYAEVMKIDYLHRWLYKDGDWSGRNTRYDDMLEDAPAGKGVLVWLGYPSYNGSFLGECARAREVLFFPFDSSQLRRAPVKTIDPREWVFTHYQYDAIHQNSSVEIDQSTPLEAWYDTSSANTIVASGISFRHDSLKVYRWKAFDSAGSWHGRPGNWVISSWNYFDHRAYYWYEMNGGNKKEYGDSLNEFREPNYIVVKGHLFLGGTADPSDTLLRIRVYYEIQRGETYRDSSNALVTADTNLRLLYEDVGITKLELFPLGPEPLNWNAYREVVKRISFRHNGGMGGPIDTIVSSAGAIPVTARGIDIEVEYMGGEKVALHAVGIRDSITNILMAPLSVSGDYYDSLTAEIRDISRADSNHVVDSAFLSIDLWDEPPPEQFAGFRKVDEHMRRTFSRPGGDSLAALHGDAYPHLQHLAYSDWVVMISYYGGGDAEAQNRWEAFNVPYDKIPAIPEHNGGRFSIPVLFPLDSLADSGFIDVARDRIALMNESFQVGLYGEANPNETFWAARGSRAGHKYRHATETRLSGRRFKVTIGPTTSVKFTYDGSTRDTFAYHTPEASELRLLASFSIAYGAKAFEYYFAEHSPWVDTAADGGPVGWFEHGFAMEGLVEPTASIVDLMVGDRSRTPKWPINKFFAGYKAYYDEMQSMGVWLKRIGGHLLDLRWRDAYSVHWQARRPGNSVDSTRQPRLLPSNEIITSVTARHPVTGAVDSAWRTYVELGLFDTKIDTTGGVRNSMNDTNFIVLVNRRIFETGNYDQTELKYSDTVKAVLDTLTETRTISLDFNLGHPDTTQYAFIRVREIEPDLAELPLVGIREPLDTIIHGDSAVELTLGPGRAALLEITYEPPDESISDGELWWSNQRKMVYYDDDRFHCTYLRNDTVFYRRSYVMGDTAASILWEPIERVVSIDPFSTRVQNWGPSMTMRAHNGDTIATIVWTCHSDSTGVRDVVLRDMITTSQTSSPIHFVDYHTGTDSTQWGDVVINAAHGGDIITWGDSLLGVVARVRKLNLFAPPVLSAKALVSLPWHTTKVGRWPTVPTFTHIRGVDSSCGIAWNQPTGVGAYSEIRYARILQLPDIGATPQDTILNGQIMSAAPKLLGRPTIDQTQDVWFRVQEGLAWIELNGSWGGHELLWFRSLYTPTNDAHYGYTDWDSIEFTQGWGFATTQGPRATTPDCYPNTSALNEVYYPIDDSLKDAHFSIALVNNEYPSLKVEQATVQYGTPSFKYAFPLNYAYGGDMPHGSSSPITQDYRHAILYEADVPGVGPVLRTSRQYFGAKVRPSGYIAGGRSVYFPIDDSTGTSIDVLMHDLWIADDASSTPLDMAGRDYTEQTDTLAEAEGLLRTAYFSAGDSTRIGIELAGRFRGDSSIGGAARVSLIAELVDSASGTVVQQLDSIAVSAAADSQHVFHMEDYDLLSGTYYIRVRLDTAGLTVENRPNGSRYAVAEYASRVGESPAARAAVRLGPTTGNAVRISAQPNPFGDRTEIRFSIGRDQNVTIVIVDASGREVARPVREERFEAGRYAVEFETGNLTEGTYVMELRAGSQRAVEKLIVRR